MASTHEYDISVMKNSHLFVSTSLKGALEVDNVESGELASSARVNSSMVVRRRDSSEVAEIVNAL